VYPGSAHTGVSRSGFPVRAIIGASLEMFPCRKLETGNRNAVKRVPSWIESSNLSLGERREQEGGLGRIAGQATPSAILFDKIDGQERIVVLEPGEFFFSGLIFQRYIKRAVGLSARWSV